MVIGQEIEQSYYQRAVGGLLFLVLAALPWIDRTNIATLLLLALSAVALFHFKGYKAAKGIWKGKLVLLSVLYYACYIVAWIRFPDDTRTQFALQQKAAFLLIPPLIYLLVSNAEKVWKSGVWGMISGTLFTLLFCFGHAVIRYNAIHDNRVFFYHNYVSPLAANAIYISVFTLVAMVFVIRKLGEANGRKTKIALLAALLFLLINLLLLSSKTLIVTGVIILAYYGHEAMQSRKLKAIIYSSLLGIVTLLLTTNNQIRERFLTIKWQQSSTALKQENYSNTNFDGLDLRLLLWRMGNELVAEKDAWLSGLGGRHYQYALNEKIKNYQLYHGYQNIDFHNQYMESFVGFGIPGLLIFLTLLIYLLVFSIQNARKDLLILCMIFFISFLTESLLENQAGILLFTIIISGEWTQRQLY